MKASPNGHVTKHICGFVRDVKLFPMVGHRLLPDTETVRSPMTTTQRLIAVVLISLATSIGPVLAQNEVRSEVETQLELLRRGGSASEIERSTKRLTELGSAAVIPLASEFATNDSEGVQRAILSALRTIGPAAAEATPALVAVFKEEEQSERERQSREQTTWRDVSKRTAIADVLGDFGPASVDPFIEILNSTRDDDTRRVVATELGQIGPFAAPAVEPLIEALWLTKDGDAKKSIEVAVRQIHEAMKLQGTLPPSLLIDLAEVYVSQGRFSEAEPLLREASNIAQVRYGAGHPEVVNSLLPLGLLYQKTGRTNEAQEAYQIALRVSRQRGELNSNTLQSLIHLARLFDNQGREQEARGLFEQAKTINDYLSMLATARNDDLRDDPNVVEFLFATTRSRNTTSNEISFTHERENRLTFGAVRVRVPEDHKIGQIELPGDRTFFGVTLGRQTADPKSHFIIQARKVMPEDRWIEIARSSSDALIFVHGYNTDFDAGVYRTAQIVWDLQFSGTAVLFSWPSWGETLAYAYDQNSALGARNHLAELISLLRTKAGIRNVHIIAHSMGNLVAMEALSAIANRGDSLKIDEFIMAAPDVDQHYYQSTINEVKKVSRGLTLYASSEDKALKLSKEIARFPRAGDIFDKRPVIVDGVEAIDVTAMGEEILGLNHTIFATHRSLINDIKLLIMRGLRPPHNRLAEIRRMPEGTDQPLFWRYAR